MQINQLKEQLKSQIPQDILKLKVSELLSRGFSLEEFLEVNKENHSTNLSLG